MAAADPVTVGWAGPALTMTAPALTLTERIDAALIAVGYDPACVRWVCEEHRRHCHRIETEHVEHACYWCDS